MSLESKRCAQCLAFCETSPELFAVLPCQSETPHVLCEACLSSFNTFFFCPLPYCRRPLHKSGVKRAECLPAQSFAKLLEKETKIECPAHKLAFTKVCLAAECEERGQPVCDSCVPAVHPHCPADALVAIPDFLSNSRPLFKPSFAQMDGLVASLDRHGLRLKEPERVLDLLKTETRFLMRSGIKRLSEDAKHFALEREGTLHLLKSALLVRLKALMDQALVVLDRQNGTPTDGERNDELVTEEALKSRKELIEKLNGIFQAWNSEPNSPKFEFAVLSFASEYASEPVRPHALSSADKRKPSPSATLASLVRTSGGKVVTPEEFRPQKPKLDLAKTTSIKKISNALGATDGHMWIGTDPDSFWDQFKEKLKSLDQNGSRSDRERVLGIHLNGQGGLELTDIGAMIAREVSLRLNGPQGRHGSGIALEAPSDSAELALHLKKRMETLESKVLAKAAETDVAMAKVSSESVRMREQASEERVRNDQTATQQAGLNTSLKSDLGKLEKTVAELREGFDGILESIRDLKPLLRHQNTTSSSDQRSALATDSFLNSRSSMGARPTSPETAHTAEGLPSLFSTLKGHKRTQTSATPDSQLEEVNKKLIKMREELDRVVAGTVNASSQGLLDECEAKVRQVEAEISKLTTQPSAIASLSHHPQTDARPRSQGAHQESSSRIFGIAKTSLEAIGTLTTACNDLKSDLKAIEERTVLAEEEGKATKEEVHRVNRLVRDLTSEIKKEFLQIRKQLENRSGPQGVGGGAAKTEDGVSGPSAPVQKQLSIPQRFYQAIQNKGSGKDGKNGADGLYASGIEEAWSPKDRPTLEGSSELFQQIAETNGGPESLGARLAKLEGAVELVLKQQAIPSPGLPDAPKSSLNSSSRRSEGNLPEGSVLSVRLESLIQDLQSLGERVLTLEIKLASVGEPGDSPEWPRSKAKGHTAASEPPLELTFKAPGNDGHEPPETLKNLMEKVKKLKHRVEVADFAIVSNSEALKADAKRLSELTEAVRDQAADLQRLDNKLKETQELLQVQMDSIKRPLDALGPEVLLRHSLEASKDRTLGSVEARLTGRESGQPGLKQFLARKKDGPGGSMVVNSARDSLPLGERQIRGQPFSGYQSLFRPKRIGVQPGPSTSKTNDQDSNPYALLH